MSLITVKEVATILCVCITTLARWRSRGEGPPWYKDGDYRNAPIKYLEVDVLKWAETIHDKIHQRRERRAHLRPLKK